MKRIFHPRGWLLTGSEVADAVLDYSRLLRSARETALIEIPVIDDCGQRATEQLVVGWDTPLVAIPDPLAGPELLGSNVAARLRQCVASGTRLRNPARAAGPRGG